ncbi:MAG: hypothetical protein HYR76_07880 [Ignavibacteria bacterium]|nr:hypothetical protein [Ignavibacteria bacterium]MBI3766783.1 hypothetical protein [Ignavibacteriales bacterium]
MGQQQLLIIILGVIVVAIAIGVGILFFTSHNISSNKDGIVSEMMVLSRLAYGYKLRPVPFGGGGNYYTGFIIPSKMDVSEHATYTATATSKLITFTGISKYGYGTVSAVLDSNGILSTFSYSGDF